MRRSSSRMLGMLCVIATTCATVFAAAAPAFAAPAHKPHATLTGDQIAKRANADLQSASSYRIYSSTTIDGLTISVSSTSTAQGCLFMIDTGDGISEKILDIGTSEWIQPSNDFWAALGYTGTVLAYLEGKWVTAAAFLKLFGISNLTSSGGTCSTRSPTGLPVTGWALVRTTRLGGSLVWRIINREKGLSAYVSDTAKPEFLRLTLLGITEYFSDYNAPITFMPPLNEYVLIAVPPPPGSGLSVRADIRSLAGITARAGLLAHASLPDRGGLPGPVALLTPEPVSLNS
jgi:hypothetical protein